MPGMIMTNTEFEQLAKAIGIETENRVSLSFTEKEIAEIIKRCKAYPKMKDVLESMIVSCQDCEFFGGRECEHQKECLSRKAGQALAENKDG